MYRDNTASTASTGDGMAMAYRAGAALRDMEMVQFAPTALAPNGILITAAARGEGAVLVGSNDAQVDSLASSDVVAQAVAKELANGDVSLDFTGVDSGRLAETRALVKDLTGIDISKDPVPVRPVMHRPIGGIKTDGSGSTGVAGVVCRR